MPTGVMSSGLCKNPEGAIAPFKVETVKDRIDNPVDAGQVNETDHERALSRSGHSAGHHDSAARDLPVRFDELRLRRQPHKREGVPS